VFLGSINVPENSTANASAVVMTGLTFNAARFFRLLTAILALKRPYLALDLGVQRSTHEIGLSPTVAGNRLGGVGLIPVDDVFSAPRQYPSSPKERRSTWLAALSSGGSSFVCGYGGRQGDRTRQFRAQR